MYNMWTIYITNVLHENIGKTMLKKDMLSLFRSHGFLLGLVRWMDWMIRPKGQSTEMNGSKAGGSCQAGDAMRPYTLIGYS
jgi:hypothetical protein